MKHVMTSTYEDLTKEEIAEIIADCYYRLKETNRNIAVQLKVNPRKQDLRISLRESGRAMNEILNLAEDLGIEFED